MKNILPCLRRAAMPGMTDRELLDALVTHRDEAAFEALLRRHGPMVLAVCRRALRNAQDAEDAFQATFLVLARKASTIRERDVLGSWLYGVAYRTAQKARTLSARRQNHERQVAPRPSPSDAHPGLDLDDELNLLPEKYRAPLVLCHLEGRSRQDVARQLNIPEGTLSSRLATARKALANQLRRHGWNSAGATAGLPPSLLASTSRAAVHLLAGRAASGVVSAQVLALTEGVIKMMFLNQLKTLSLALIVLGTLGVGTTWLTYRAAASGSPAGQGTPARDDRLDQAKADLAAAQANLKRAEAELAAAQAQVAQKKAAYEQALLQAGRGERADPGAAAAAVVGRFRYRVPFELGHTETSRGGRLEILEVWGTRPKIEVGGQYLVRGKYVLPARQGGTLYFHLTASDWNNAFGPDLDLQRTEVESGQGEFTLLHGMNGPGSFHLHLTALEQGKWITFANVYFGTGDNVWRPKQEELQKIPLGR
jgi:RNA polymerase sigma factor (sigma-70 family)